MLFSKGFEYAVSSLVHLASLPDGKTACLCDIASARMIPVSYLAKVMRSLVKGGLVTSTLGREGGYSLRRTPKEINLLEICEVMEGKIAFVECMVDESSCSFFLDCTHADVWKQLGSTMEAGFRNTTLHSLSSRRRNAESRLKNAKEKRNGRAGA